MLKDIDNPTYIKHLEQDDMKELQKALHFLGLNPGPIDGYYGRRTATAWAAFKEDVHQGNPDMIGQGSVEVLLNKIDIKPGNFDFSTKDDTINSIVKLCKDHYDLRATQQIAYVLATVEWESAKTFQPVREAFYISKSFDKAEEYRKNSPVIKRYYPYYGRGYVQITWKGNYQRYSDLLGIDMVNNPDLALDPLNAAIILVHGFKSGNFTGRKLEDYINSSTISGTATSKFNAYVNARRCINGMDHAHDIARLANKYA